MQRQQHRQHHPPHHHHRNPPDDKQRLNLFGSNPAPPHCQSQVRSWIVRTTVLIAPLSLPIAGPRVWGVLHAGNDVVVWSLRFPRRRLVLLWTMRVGQTFFWTDILRAKPCSLQAWARFLRKEKQANARAGVRSCTLWKGLLRRRNVRRQHGAVPGASSSSSR